MASLAPMDDLFPERKPSPLLGLGVSLVLLEADVRRFRVCWEEFMAAPFPDYETRQASLDYAADEDQA
jgi:hypothetical protein